MTPSLLFPILNAAVLPAWLLLVFAPRWRRTQMIALATSAALAIVYAVVLFSTDEGGGDLTTLAAVKEAFSHEGILLAAWTHYLVFDLFVGAWQVRDAQSREVRHLFVVPCLFLTLMLGPVGFVSYLALRRFAGRAPDAEVARTETI